ncbi:LlaJI family restriction endonuclease [Enterorhabdus caecimuris]|nr:LlaJI family restriction endonuclease [Adlercreutzia caecimuris]
MEVCYLQELSYWTAQSLGMRLGVDIEFANELIQALATRGVLKLKSNDEIDEYDLLGSDTVDVRGKYQFVFVGLAIYKDVVLVVYPKYFGNSTPTIGQMRVVFKVIMRSMGGKPQAMVAAEDEMGSNDRLALTLAILDMYGEYGEYANHTKEYRINGSGDISWERTLERHQPFLSGGAPVYLDYETAYTTRDQSDFITRLHRVVVTKCSADMRACGISDFLAIDDIELSDEAVDDLGDATTLEYKIDNELGVQYVTWKQDLLRLLRAYVLGPSVMVPTNMAVCLGTSSFYHIWELGCKAAFGDQLDVPLNKLPIKLNGYWAKRSTETLLSIIPKPRWYVFEDGERSYSGPASTLIPDTVAIWQGDVGSIFAIMDAKYYTPSLEGAPRRVPGVESVTKQHLYQAAYRKFVLDCGFERVVNVFLVPTCASETTLMGEVEFPSIFEKEPAPFAYGVQMWTVPAEDVWRCYLGNRQMEDAKDVIARAAR